MNARIQPKAPMAPSLQPDLFDAPDAVPAGFGYQPDLITQDEEVALVRRLGELPFQPFDFHGHLANRCVVGFGLRYDYGRRAVMEAPPVPDWLMTLRTAIGQFARRPAEAFVQVLVNQYRPGAGIGWHRDKPHFDDVVGVSLLAPCTLRFRRKAGEGWERKVARVDPRSGYLLRGPSRTDWEHSIPEMDQLRYSITFRTLAEVRARRADAMA